VCRAAKQQQQDATPRVQQHVAVVAIAAASLLVGPAAHAATELMQPGMDVATAVGSGAAVAGLGALLVATDPQKRCVACVARARAWGGSLSVACWCCNSRLAGGSRIAFSLARRCLCAALLACPQSPLHVRRPPPHTRLARAGVRSRWRRLMATSWRR
jgi:hypothetical protein